MKKNFCLFLLFLCIPFLSLAKEPVYIVSDVFSNVFTLNGVDYYREDDSLPMELGDHCIVWSEEKVPLPDRSYCLVAELTHVESGVTKSFVSTTMNDQDEATVQEIKILSAEIEKHEKRQLQEGGYFTYYVPVVKFIVHLEDGTSYHVWYAELPDNLSIDKAKQTLEDFLSNPPKSVTIRRDDYLFSSEGKKFFHTYIEYPNGMRFLGSGKRRKRGKDVFSSEIKLNNAGLGTCIKCEKEAWHLFLSGFGSLCSFAYKDHSLVHAHSSPIPICYTQVGDHIVPVHSLKLLRIYEEAPYGRIFVMQVLPEKKEFHLFVDKKG